MIAYTRSEMSLFDRIKTKFSVGWLNQPTAFRDFFWTRRKALKVSEHLRAEVEELLKDAHDQKMVAGYRGYILNIEKAEIVLKTPLYVAEQPLTVFLADYIEAVSPEYVDPKTLMILVEAVKYGEAEKSDADILDDAILDLPRSTVLRGLQVTAMNDILDILREHGVYEATYEADSTLDEIEQ